MDDEPQRRKMRLPFLTVDHNFVINVNHIVWFDWHSDQTLTVCLSQPGPNGDRHINIIQPDTIKSFLENFSQES